MNEKNLKKLYRKDNSANIADTLRRKFASLKDTGLRGIVAPESAKEGGFILAYRNRIKRNTLFSMFAAIGADEKICKAVGGIHSRGKAALICSVLDDVTDGRLFCPASVKEEAQRYLADLKRSDYECMWYNLGIFHDVSARLKAATALLDESNDKCERAMDACEKAADKREEARKIQEEAAMEARTAAAMTAAERGAEVAAMQEECECA